VKALANLVLATIVSAQSELPKDVIQLSQIRREVAKSVATLDNYTCVETIDRATRKNARQNFQHMDTVNVEVAVVNNRELFSRPGAKGFEDPDVRKLPGSGLISTGGFAAAIKNVLLNNVSTIRFHGVEEILGRQTLRWDYAIPYNLSGWDVQMDGRTGRVSEAGSFWADAETLDLLRLEIAAQDIPPGLGAAAITERLDYSRVRVRSRDLLLPKSVETSVIKFSGAESRNRMRFSHCRAFEGEAELKFSER
jgi:hypothetical protein